MHVDESKDKIYIYDLDKELQEAESGDERVVFLPDIERKISRIPKSVLETPSDPGNQELVLYSVPSSISIPEEQDNVRKVISEVRARAREAQNSSGSAHQAGHSQGQGTDEEDESIFENTPIVEEIDDDVMDID